MLHEQLMPRQITDKRVLQVMRSVPRHSFVREELRDAAYQDRALPTIHDQTISQPYMVAFMTQILDVEATHNVLEIGTGSGYQTAILAQLSRQVYTIEQDADLSEQARETLDAMHVSNVSYHVGDGSLGLPDQAPFDRILVTAAAPQVPQSYFEQIQNPGRIVIPLGYRLEQVLNQVDVFEGRSPRYIKHFACRFVPLLGAQGFAD